MFDPAIVQLNAIGIMHTNVSEANMMVLRTDKGQGFLVGFEFAIVDSGLCDSKRRRSESLQDSDGATTQKSREMTPAIPGQAFDDAAAHHVATLALSRCSDYPPVHRFQHELESFVWSIFFILSGFRCGRRIINTDLEKWYVGDWKSIENAKRGFLRQMRDGATFAGEFAESLGVDQQPLIAFSRSLANMLAHPEQLRAAPIFSALQQAHDAYAKGSAST